MKTLFDIIMEDYRREGFSLSDWIKYGVIGPILFILLTSIQ